MNENGKSKEAGDYNLRIVQERDLAALGYLFLADALNLVAQAAAKAYMARLLIDFGTPQDAGDLRASVADLQRLLLNCRQGAEKLMHMIANEVEKFTGGRK